MYGKVSSIDNFTLNCILNSVNNNTIIDNIFQNESIPLYLTIRLNELQTSSKFNLTKTNNIPLIQKINSTTLINNFPNYVLINGRNLVCNSIRIKEEINERNFKINSFNLTQIILFHQNYIGSSSSFTEISIFCNNYHLGIINFTILPNNIEDLKKFVPTYTRNRDSIVIFTNLTNYIKPLNFFLFSNSDKIYSNQINILDDQKSIMNISINRRSNPFLKSIEKYNLTIIYSNIPLFKKEIYVMFNIFVDILNQYNHNLRLYEDQSLKFSLSKEITDITTLKFQNSPFFIVCSVNNKYNVKPYYDPASMEYIIRSDIIIKQNKEIIDSIYINIKCYHFNQNNQNNITVYFNGSLAFNYQILKLPTLLDIKPDFIMVNYNLSKFYLNNEFTSTQNFKLIWSKNFFFNPGYNYNIFINGNNITTLTITEDNYIHDLVIKNFSSLNFNSLKLDISIRKLDNQTFKNKIIPIFLIPFFELLKKYVMGVNNSYVIYISMENYKYDLKLNCVLGMYVIPIISTSNYSFCNLNLIGYNQNIIEVFIYSSLLKTNLKTFTIPILPPIRLIKSSYYFPISKSFDYNFTADRNVSSFETKVYLLVNNEYIYNCSTLLLNIISCKNIFYSKSEILSCYFVNDLHMQILETFSIYFQMFPVIDSVFPSYFNSFEKENTFLLNGRDFSRNLIQSCLIGVNQASYFEILNSNQILCKFNNFNNISNETSTFISLVLFDNNNFKINNKLLIVDLFNVND